MIIRPDGTVHYLTVNEHLQHQTIVYQDQDHTMRLQRHPVQPFSMSAGNGAADIYIDLFAVRFGQKEQTRRKTGKGWVPIHYGCPRAERDSLLFLPVEELVEEPARRCCSSKACQYWSHPTGVKGRYAFNCILLRYRAMGLFDQKVGLTLEEVGRIYACTRERIRQIQNQALHRLRYHTRLNRMQPFRERVIDYRDYTPSATSDVA